MKNFNELFYKRTSLLLRVISFIKDEPCFALKGGTAINLFVRDLPRLSVDIDLAYLPIQPHAESIANINHALERIANAIQSKMKSLQVNLRRNKEDDVYKIYVNDFNAGIIIETTPIFRGSVFPSQSLGLCKLAQQLFEIDLEVNALSIPDLYAGKICAALNRQHPRDLYDIKILLDVQELSREIIQAFVIYLAGDNRPIHELLDCKIKQNQEELFKRDLLGMVRGGIEYFEIENIVERLKVLIKNNLTDDEKKFLISLACGNPIWHLLSIPHAAELPALKWKVLNINKMDEEKRKKAVEHLQDYLGLRLYQG